MTINRKTYLTDTYKLGKVEKEARSHRALTDAINQEFEEMQKDNRTNMHAQSGGNLKGAISAHYGTQSSNINQESGTTE